MNPASNRERSHSEMVFGTLRVLMASYQLWGGEGGLTLDDLAALLGVRARVANHPTERGGGPATRPRARGTAARRSPPSVMRPGPRRRRVVEACVTARSCVSCA